VAAKFLGARFMSSLLPRVASQKWTPGFCDQNTRNLLEWSIARAANRKSTSPNNALSEA
jgi:hypothetical protein